MAQVSYYSEDKKQGLEGRILALRGISGQELSEAQLPLVLLADTLS